MGSFVRRAFFVFFAGLASIASLRAEPVKLTHVHGLAYSADGRRLIVPSHDGLAVFERDAWSKEPGAPHDYMGFSASAKGFYSSGHPAGGSGMANPLGIVRSRDGGKSWDKLGLEGESDFHLLATSWNTSAIYVWNPMPNSRMREAALHYTSNDGFMWTMAQASGLEGEPRALAVHPDKPALMAVATPNGIFESVDWGRTFAQLAGAAGTAVFYDLDGKHLWYGLLDGNRARLARARLRGGPMAWISVPFLENDAVAYIAQNPVSRAEYAIATSGRSVYLSTDAGRRWSQIADRGASR